MNRTLTISLDKEDYEAIQQAVKRRSEFGKNYGGTEETLLPDGTSDFQGACLAEICRGWEEMLNLNRPLR